MTKRLTESQVSMLKSSRGSVRFNLREVVKVTQWKEGCVYRTKSLGLIICKPDYMFTLNQAISLSPVSTSVTRQLF